AWFPDHVPTPIMRVAISGVPLFAPQVDHALLGLLARDAAHLERLKAQRLGSLLVVPLRTGRVVGALVLGYSVSGRAHQPRDLQAALELARKAGLAIDSALRHQAAEAESRAEHQLLRVLSR